jgi:hypothetical protein
MLAIQIWMRWVVGVLSAAECSWILFQVGGRFVGHMRECAGFRSGGVAAREGQGALAAGGAAPGKESGERVDAALQKANALHPDGLRTALAALHGNPAWAGVCPGLVSRLRGGGSELDCSGLLARGEFAGAAAEFAIGAGGGALGCAAGFAAGCPETRGHPLAGAHDAFEE